jgi:hypothetical protein
MNDEVNRLRMLRKAALQGRALAEVLNHATRRDAVLSRAALLCWRVARIATARLRAHPYERYQRDPSWSEHLDDGLRVRMQAWVAGLRGRRIKLLSRQIDGVAREVDDVRRLTLSPDLSDSLGRAQEHLRPLLEQIARRARTEGGAKVEVELPAPSEDAVHSRYMVL